LPDLHSFPTRRSSDLLPGTLGHPDVAPGANVDSTVSPSIEILPNQSNLASTCGGTPFDVKTFINVDNMASAAVTLSAPTLGTLRSEEHTSELQSLAYL